MELIRKALASSQGPRNRLPDDQLLDQVIDQVRELNGGDLDDDLAIIALGCAGSPPREPQDK
jgi:serine phosphatase RsbU (regulator of sigma subunit)